MAAREFHGVIKNEWENPLVHNADDCDSGQWQDPWYPSRVPGVGQINPQEEGEWRSESGGVMTGTSGWARWSVFVIDDINVSVENPGHTEFVQVNWSISFFTDPHITWGVSRNDPFNPDPRPPTLEIIGISLTADDGKDTALVVTSELLPYVFTIPVSWFKDQPDFSWHRPRAKFVVRRKAENQAKSPLTFSNAMPSRQDIAAHGFMQRAEFAVRNGFIGGFPNFYESTNGQDHFGGAILIKSAAAEWRNVSIAELGNVSLDDFEKRMQATHEYASKNGFVGGFPTFFHADYGSGIVCSTILLNSDAAEYRNIPFEELGNPALDDFESHFRAIQDFATRHHFVGGFPTLHHAKVVVERDIHTGRPIKTATACGAVLLKHGGIDILTGLPSHSFAELRDILLFRGPD